MNLKIHGYLKLTWEMQDRLLGITFRLCLGSQRPEGGVVLGLDYHVSDFHMLYLFHVGYINIVIYFVCILISGMTGNWLV